jgi:hypothetical protein
MSESEKKPKAKLIGENGNIFNLMGIATRALKNAGQPEKAKEMQEKIFTADCYEESLRIIREYVDVS